MRRLFILGVLGLFVLAARPGVAQSLNWTGDFASCDHHSDLLSRGPISIGVKFSTSNHIIEEEFKKALDFWSGIIEMEWHEDDTSTCAMNVVDGTPDILTKSVIARSQFPEWGNFEGWIAFDPTAPLSDFEIYVTAVHEIGHMLGLKHNPRASSIMYFLDLEGPEVLDKKDLLSLAEHHDLRVSPADAPIPVRKEFSLAHAKTRSDSEARADADAASTALTKQP